MTADAFAARGLLWLLDGVASAHDVTADEMLAHDRHQRPTAARHDLWRRLRERGWSYPEIGKATGFDHTTVMYACRGKVRPSKADPKGPPPARKARPPIGDCHLCAAAFEPHSGKDRAYCVACRRWRRKCWLAGVPAPSAGAAE